MADLLILKEQMPRSLAACYRNIVTNLDLLATTGGRRGPAQRGAHNIYRTLSSERIEKIFQTGLHEFITQFISQNAGVGNAISAQYLA